MNLLPTHMATFLKQPRALLLNISLAALGCLCARAAPTTGLDVRDFGAKGDGTTKDTQAIQAAIDKASVAGGTVVIGPGNYPSGTLHLRSNLTLRLERGARLMFSPDDADFDAYEALPYRMTAAPEHRDTRPQPANPRPEDIRRLAAPPAWDDTETSYAHYSLLCGDGVHNVSIEGPGEIDGNRPRRGGPKPIAFKNSEWISIRGITVRNAPNYNISLMGTDHVEVEGVKLLNGYADGVDPDNCHFVRITNSYIDAWDDAICPKASYALGKRRGTEHLVVANCILRTSCNHFKFGTESEGDLKNVSVTNCVMLNRDSGRAAIAGISLEAVDGANIDGVVVSNISIENAKVPVFIRLGNRARSMDKPAPGSIRNVSIQNVTATGATIASSITGVEGGRVQDVLIDGLTVTAKGGGARGDLEVAEVAAKYPDGDMFGDLPAFGMYARHADGITLKNLKLHAAQQDGRPAVIMDDVSRLELSGLDSTNSGGTEPTLLFRNVAGALLYGNRVSAPVPTFLSVMGDKSANIALRSNDLRLAKKGVDSASGVPGNALSLEP